MPYVVRTNRFEFGEGVAVTLACRSRALGVVPRLNGQSEVNTGLHSGGEDGPVLREQRRETIDNIRLRR